MATEIERVFLLTGMPANMPAGEVWKIDQGYLQPDPHAALTEGRVRRTTHADGSVSWVHTIKRGIGRIRHEQEQQMTQQQFDAAWPRTAGRRIRKIRTRIAHGALVWEIDQFLDLPLCLAECELPAPDTQMPIPEWLKPVIVREVTEEPEFRNYQLAVKAGALGQT